jgi:hypothetical protein
VESLPRIVPVLLRNYMDVFLTTPPERHEGKGISS